MSRFSLFRSEFETVQSCVTVAMSFYQAARSWARRFAVAIDRPHRDLRSTRPGELGGDPAWGWRGENVQRRTDGDCEKAKCNI